MTSRTGRKRTDRAFTLIELILLALILAVLAAISTPLFSKTFSSLRLRDSAYNLAKLVNFVQEKAVLEGRVYKLALDAKKGRYYVMVSKGPEAKKFIHLEEKIGRVFTLPEGIEMKADKKEVFFYPDGHSGKATVTLSGGKRKTRLTVRGNMGYVEVEE